MAKNTNPPGATPVAVGSVYTGDPTLAGHTPSPVGTASTSSGLDGHMVGDLVPVGKSGTMPHAPARGARTLFGNFHD